MILVLWIFATILVASHSATIDIEKTVLRVQNILQQNEQLPRLSREEILQLLDDIRAEDAKKSALVDKSRKLPDEPTEFDLVDQKEFYSTDINDEDKYNEINPVSHLPNEDKNSVFVDDNTVSASMATESPEEKVTKKNEPTMMVVFPFTPRDGKSLQELYTKQPRVEVVPLPTTPAPKLFQKSKSESKIKESLTNNVQVAQNSQKLDYSEELQEFLKAHGFEGKPGQDSFLLPLEGFKPLPPPKIVDGNVQLPENILLTYDLITPEAITKSDNGKNLRNNKLFKYPYELDASSSEDQKTVLPLDLPKSRKPKSAQSTETSPLQSFEAIDYDSVKVIPLSPGPSPIDQGETVELTNELDKRQTSNISLDFVFNSTADPETLTTSQSNDVSPETTTTTSTEASSDTKTSDSDAGPSFADLEDSFGGAAPSEPGDSELPPPKKNGFYWMLDWNSFLEVGDGDTKVDIRLEPKLGDPQMFLPVNVP